MPMRLSFWNTDVYGNVARLTNSSRKPVCFRNSSRQSRADMEQWRNDKIRRQQVVGFASSERAALDRPRREGGGGWVERESPLIDHDEAIFAACRRVGAA